MRFGDVMQRLEQLARELGYIKDGSTAQPVKPMPKAKQPSMDIRLPYKDPD